MLIQVQRKTARKLKSLALNPNEAYDTIIIRLFQILEQENDQFMCSSFRQRISPQGEVFKFKKTKPKKEKRVKTK